jgi:hypothetical protein
VKKAAVSRAKCANEERREQDAFTASNAFSPWAFWIEIIFSWIFSEFFRE